MNNIEQTQTAPKMSTRYLEARHRVREVLRDFDVSYSKLYSDNRVLGVDGRDLKFYALLNLPNRNDVRDNIMCIINEQLEELKLFAVLVEDEWGIHSIRVKPQPAVK